MKRRLHVLWPLGVVAVVAVALFIAVVPSATGRSPQVASADWVTQVGAGLITPACGSSSVGPTCSNGAPVAPFTWTSTTGATCTSVTLTIKQGATTVATVPSLACSGSYTWTGGTVGTAYTYAIADQAAHAIASGSFTMPASCPCANGANNSPACNQCPDGYAYLSGSCSACSNGGCSGAGGNTGSPYGSLVCNNSAVNPVSCSTFPATAALSPNPGTIDSGQSSTLTWSSANATSCTSAGGFSTGGATSGSASVSPSSTSAYQVTCTGPGGTSAPASATVTVLNPNATISVAPNRVPSGATTVVTWSSGDVVSCTETGPGLSASSLSGHSAAITVTGQSTYTITCQTLGSPVTQSATVDITPGFQEF